MASPPARAKAGVTSELSLYSKELATYDQQDRFDHKAALGFITIYGLSARTQPRLQSEALAAPDIRARIVPPDVEFE